METLHEVLFSYYSLCYVASLWFYKEKRTVTDIISNIWHFRFWRNLKQMFNPLRMLVNTAWPTISKGSVYNGIAWSLSLSLTYLCISAFVGSPFFYFLPFATIYFFAGFFLPLFLLLQWNSRSILIKMWLAILAETWMNGLSTELCPYMLDEGAETLCVFLFSKEFCFFGSIFLQHM